MTTGISSREGKRARSVGLRVGFAVAAVLFTTACATQSYMDVSVVPKDAPSEVQELARRAQSGDKQAQLDLGIRFEEGNGVLRDKRRAVRLYRQAASDSGGTMWVYMPSPGNGAPGRAVPIDRGPKQPGLVQAREQLTKLIGLRPLSRHAVQSDNDSSKGPVSTPDPLSVLTATVDITASNDAYMRRLEKLTGPKHCSTVYTVSPIGQINHCVLGNPDNSLPSLVIDFKNPLFIGQPPHDTCREEISISDCVLTLYIHFDTDYIYGHKLRLDRCTSKERVRKLMARKGWILTSDQTSSASLPGREAIGTFVPGVEWAEYTEFYGLKSSTLPRSKSAAGKFLTTALIKYPAQQNCVVRLRTH